MRSSTSGWLTSCDGAGGQRGAAAVVAAAVAIVVVAAAVAVAAADKRRTEMSAVGELQLRQLLLTVGLTGARLRPVTDS